jgi:hypothetical protein
MKRLLYFSVILLFLSNCKNDSDAVSMDFMPQSVPGKWLLTETEQTVNGKQVWQAANVVQPEYIIFRSDGVILNEKEEASCCSPQILNVNNKQFEIKPQQPVNFTQDCSQIFCGSCPVWDIELKGDEMIISKCQTPRAKICAEISKDL